MVDRGLETVIIFLPLSPFSHKRARACHAERRRREAPAFQDPWLRGLPKEKAGPSLRARAARSAQDDKPLALSKEKEEPEFQAVV